MAGPSIVLHPSDLNNNSKPQKRGQLSRLQVDDLYNSVCPAPGYLFTLLDLLSLKERAKQSLLLSSPLKYLLTLTNVYTRRSRDSFAIQMDVDCTAV